MRQQRVEAPLFQVTFANWDCLKILNTKTLHWLGCREDSGVQSTGFMCRVPVGRYEGGASG